MTNEKSNPTLADVAHRADVSPTTVSRVINAHPAVNAETRKRVLEAITALGYKPALSQGTQHVLPGTIALVITDILNPFFPEIVRGVEDEAGTSGLALILCHTSEDPLREQQTVQILSERRVDGIIACASRMAAQNLIALQRRHNTPMVLINRRVDEPCIPCITIDFADAAYRAAQHLLSQQHTRIAYLPGRSTAESSQARRRGIETALTGVGLRLRSEWCPESFPNIEGGFQATSVLLEQPPAERPTAVIAYNDIIAIGALQAIRAHHLRVPEDISVVGFDDIAVAAHTHPPLTTINQPKYRMGQLAMRMLRQIMQKQYMPCGGYTLVESPLIVRGSTGPAPAAP
jgi:DNA-binding LacI/PurR family transcriptional regulator